MKLPELIEQLADKEHASWARWMKYLFSLCERDTVPGNPGDLVIPAERVVHWERQIAASYADLSEREKGYDREEVAYILPIIQRYVDEEADHRVENALMEENFGEDL